MACLQLFLLITTKWIESTVKSSIVFKVYLKTAFPAIILPLEKQLLSSKDLTLLLTSLKIFPMIQKIVTWTSKVYWLSNNLIRMAMVVSLESLTYPMMKTEHWEIRHTPKITRTISLHLELKASSNIPLKQDKVMQGCNYSKSWFKTSNNNNI